MAYPEAKSNYPFSRQLALLVKELAMPAPFFKGKKLPSDVPGVERCEIHSFMIADPANPEEENRTKIGLYTSWDKGIDIAMYDMLSRMCYLHHDKLTEDSNFRYLGKRNEEGQALVTGGDRTHMNWAEKHFEDLEIHVMNLEDLVDMKAEEANLAQAVVQTQGQEIDMLNTLVEIKEEAIAAKDEAIAARDQLLEIRDQQIVAKNATIAALQAQLNQPPRRDDETSDDDSDDDNDDDEGGDEGGANAEASEEEDPEERVYYLSSDVDSGEEYTPPSRAPRGKKRKCVKSTTYLKKFKN